MGNIIGKNIHTLRKKQGLTQEELAGLVNVSFQAVSKWENGVSHS
ncbi:MAG: helix-turn-helix domain-containing protein [Clostridium sp.]|nr:helix-turn-helix domain-containing protein [Clostridium sp.]